MELAGMVIYVDDVPTVADFYQRAFGIGVKFIDVDVQLPNRLPNSKYQFAELATTGGPLHLATHELGSLLLPGYTRPVDGCPSGIEVAFFTDDVARAFERAVRSGATVVAEPKVMPWGQTVSYVRSVEGTFIGICSRPNS